MNSGVGLGIDFNWLFYLLACLSLTFYFVKKKEFSLGLILTGGVGNLIDRLINGKISDWIPVGFLGLWINLADLYISTGVILWLTQKFYTKTKI